MKTLHMSEDGVGVIEEKKLFYKVYQDRNSMDFNYFVARPESVEAEIESVFENQEELLPMLEAVYMTESEFNALPAFEGY